MPSQERSRGECQHRRDREAGAKRPKKIAIRRKLPEEEHDDPELERRGWQQRMCEESIKPLKR